MKVADSRVERSATKKGGTTRASRPFVGREALFLSAKRECEGRNDDAKEETPADRVAAHRQVPPRQLRGNLRKRLRAAEQWRVRLLLSNRRSALADHWL